MKRLGIILIAFFIMACEPAIHFDAAKLAGGSTPIQLGFRIENQDTDISEPRVRLFLKYNDTQQFNVTDKLKSTGDHAYSLTLSGIDAGEYRLVVEVPYSTRFMGFKLYEQVKSAAHDFVVHGDLPANCYGFDKTKNDLEGWTVKGVFVGNREKPLGKATCPGLFYVNHSWPFPLNETVQGGSIFVPVSDNCFPKPGQQATQNNRWQISFVSPDLSGNGHWQQLKRLAFRIATKSIPVQVSPEIHYQVGKDVRSTYWHKQLTPHYAVTGGQWVVIDHPVELPSVAKVTRLSLHVSGIPEQTVTTEVDSIFLDGVCPQNQ